MDRQEHLYDALPRGEEVIGLIEDTMSQTGTYQDAHEAIDEQGFKFLVGDALLLIQPAHHQIGQCQSDEPHQRVPADAERADAEGFKRRVPENITEDIHDFSSFN